MAQPQIGWDDVLDLGGQNASAPAPTQAAPQSAAPAQPTQPADPYAGAVAPLADGHTMGFADEAPTEAQSTQLSPDQEKALIDYARQPGATADGLRQLGASMGRTITNADEVFKARDAGAGVNDAIHYPLPQIQGGTSFTGAMARGDADAMTVGAAPRIRAVIQSAYDVAHGGDWDYSHNLDYERGLQAADMEQHPYARIGGQLLGGLVLPSGTEGVAFTAGRDALQGGASMAEARAIAAAAARNRMAQVGAGYGGAYGFNSSYGDPGQRLASTLAGAAEGGVGGLALGAAGEATAPILQRRAAQLRAAPLPDPNEVEQATNPNFADLATRLNITPTPATTGGMVSHAIQMGFGNYPGGASAVARGVERENQGLADSVRGVADNIGTVGTRESAGDAIAQDATAYRTASRVQATERYNMRDQLYGGPTAPVPTDNLTAAYQDIYSRFPTSDAVRQLNEHSVLRRLLDPATSGRPLTLAEATEALSHVRGVERSLSRNGTATGPVLARVSQIEQALEDDVMAAGQRADQAANRTPGAPGSAVRAQQDADAFYRDRKAALNGSLKLPLKSANDPTITSGTQVYNQVLADAQIKGGNLARLRDTWFRISDGGRNTFAATALDDMGRSLPGAQNAEGDVWSFDRFLTNYNSWSPQARNIIFGARSADQLRDIAAYASRLRDLGKTRNFSNTARNWFATGIMAGVGSALWHGAPMEALGIAGSVPTSYAAARLFLATPAMRQWTVSALRAASIGNPQRAASAGRELTARLGQIAAANPAIASDVLGLQRRLQQWAASSGSAPLAAQNEKKARPVPPQGQPNE